MAQDLYFSSSAAATTLSSSITGGQTTMVVGAVTGFPVSFPYVLILDYGTATEEAVLVTAGAGTSLTITRGYDSTTATSHAAGASVQHGVVAKPFNDFYIHKAATSGVHGLTGTVVGTSDSQTLTNKNLTSGTNTFPSSLATLTGAQALTNKDLTSGTNTFPSTLVATTGNQSIAGNKTFTGNTVASGGSGATPTLQLAPGTDTIPLQILRGTDSSPAQNLISVRNHANNADIYTLDASGNSVGNAFNAFSANIRNITAGAFFAADSLSLKVQRGTDSSPTQDVVQVTNAAANVMLWKIDNNGNVVNKYPAQVTQQTANVGSITTAEVTVSNGSTSSFTFDGNTKVRVSFDWFGMQSTAAADTWEIRLKDSVAGVIHAQRIINQKVSSTEAGGHLEVVVTPSAAAHTFSAVMIRVAGTGTGTLAAGATSPATLTVTSFI